MTAATLMQILGNALMFTGAALTTWKLREERIESLGVYEIKPTLHHSAVLEPHHRNGLELPRRSIIGGTETLQGEHLVVGPRDLEIFEEKRCTGSDSYGEAT